MQHALRHAAKHIIDWFYFVLAILKGADLDTISAKKVRLQLQQELGVDLLSRKEEIDQIIMADVDQVNSHSDEEQSEEEVPKGKDDSESEPESEVRLRTFIFVYMFVILHSLWRFSLFYSILGIIIMIGRFMPSLLQAPTWY